MNNRNIPFGYQYADGKVIVHTREADVLKEITEAYLSGQSLLKIAKELNDRAIEYTQGITGWNKARMMRILEDKRYLGTEMFPQLMDNDTYETIQKLKADKNTKKHMCPKEEIYKIEIPVKCPRCGSAMHRRHDSRCACAERWVCSDKDCRDLIVISDEELLGRIKEILNLLINHPDIINAPENVSMNTDTEILKIENEIHRMLDMTGFDKEELRQKLWKRFSMKYESIDHAEYEARKMKDIFTSTSSMEDNPSELMKKTVKEILLNDDKTVSLTLINGQAVGKE